jgi:hypothetical protein
MTETSTPLIRACRIAHKHLLDALKIGGLKGVEASFSFAFQEQLPGHPILNDIIPRVKFKKDIIFTE